MLIMLLNAVVTRKHGPIRHLLFVYELLSGVSAHPDHVEHVPNRSLQLLLGVVQQIMMCAMATFLVAQLSVPVTTFPVRSLADLALHPEYRVCVPRLIGLAQNLSTFIDTHSYPYWFDKECLKLIRSRNLDKLVDHLCDQNTKVVVLASDAIMNVIFQSERIINRMCAIVPIERNIVGNWISVPFSPKFKHGELLKQFIRYRNYSSIADMRTALNAGDVDVCMIFDSIQNISSNRMMIVKMDQHLYLPINHTHHSDTFFFDVFSHELRCVVLSFVVLITLLNAIVTSRHAPIRHLLFIYELLGGVRAFPHPVHHVPNRSLVFLVGVVQQVLSCALATFLVAQLSIPLPILKVSSFDDLAKHPEYKVCIPRLDHMANHIPALVSADKHQNRFDSKCLRLLRAKKRDELADYLCDLNTKVVVLASDVIMNYLFGKEQIRERMCDIIPIERNIVGNWISVPYSSKFKHGNLLKNL
uniref:Uncharacterized protein n=1 Tax=Anopheles farauti TaxID=69004 RepID=A0A182R184_9DIPT